MSNRDPDFYPLIGPFLARREIEKELGYRLYDDDGKTWYVALDRGVVIGFCAARATTTGAVWSSAYVVSARRREGAYRQLWQARDGEWDEGPVRATCTLASLAMFLEHGFERVRNKGRYVEVRRD